MIDEISSILDEIQGNHWQLGKKYGKYGNFFAKNMGGLWDGLAKI